MRAPGMAWRRLPVFSWAAAICSWLLLVIGPIMLAALTMLMIDRNFEGIFFAGGCRRRAAALAAPELDLLHRRLHAGPDRSARSDRRDRPGLARKPLFNRSAVIGSIVGDRRDRHARLDAEHADRADRHRLDVLRDDHGAGADRALRPGLLQPDRDPGRRRGADAGAAALRRRCDLGDLDRPRRRRSRTRWSPPPGSLQKTTDSHRGDPFRPRRRRRLRRLRRPALVVPEDDRAHDGREPGPDLLLDDGRGDARSPSSRSSSPAATRARWSTPTSSSTAPASTPTT